MSETPAKHISSVIATAINAACLSPMETATPRVNPSRAPPTLGTHAPSPPLQATGRHGATDEAAQDPRVLGLEGGRQTPSINDYVVEKERAGLGWACRLEVVGGSKARTDERGW